MTSPLRPSGNLVLGHVPSLEPSSRGAATLRLLQLSSSSLPVGGFAYSNGLESLVESGHITDERTLVEYLATLSSGTLGRLDLPRLLRMHRAFLARDLEEAERQSAWLQASRESAEFQAQERQMASSLLKILTALIDAAPPSGERSTWKPKTYAEAYAFACVKFDVDEPGCLLGYAWVWVDSHTTAAAKLLSLGPIAVQRVLCTLLTGLPAVVEHAYGVSEADIGFSAPGLGIASARHETQYTRLFRS